MIDYSGDMVYRRWRSEIAARGYGTLNWRWACQFYGLLGMFYQMDREFVKRHLSDNHRIEYRVPGWGTKTVLGNWVLLD